MNNAETHRSTFSIQFQKLFDLVEEALTSLDEIEENDEVIEEKDCYEKYNSNVIIVSFPTSYRETED